MSGLYVREAWDQNIPVRTFTILKCMTSIAR